MRQDIVDVLKTSKQNLVRALIGLLSVAAARWGRVRTLLLATAIFREAGRLWRQQSEKCNSLTRLKTETLNGGQVKLHTNVYSDHYNQCYICTYLHNTNLLLPPHGAHEHYSTTSEWCTHIPCTYVRMCICTYIFAVSNCCCVGPSFLHTTLNYLQVSPSSLCVFLSQEWSSGCQGHL